MTDEIIPELKAKKEAKPFERFAFILNDGRVLPVEGRFRFAFNLTEVVVIGDDDRINHFKYDQITKIETLTPAS